MKYVLAISGGVDSSVLLDLVATNHKNFRVKNFPGATFPDDFIVAHFEHGIRGQQSQADAAFVRDLAGKYSVEFVLGEGNLPPDCNEETARAKRYEFLFNCHPELVSGSTFSQKNNLAKKIPKQVRNDIKVVVAHHQDDLLETIVINLIRGTNWRGLAPMTGDVARPLLSMNKSEIVAYAIDRNLDWVEEDANYGSRYFRNRVRDFLVRTDEKDRQVLLELYERQKTLRKEIEKEISRVCYSILAPKASDAKHFSSQDHLYRRQKASQPHRDDGRSAACLAGKNGEAERTNSSTAWVPGQTRNDETFLSRYYLTMIDEKSALEILRFATKGQLTYPQLKTALLFSKTALPHKKLDFKGVEIRADRRHVTLDFH